MISFAEGIAALEAVGYANAPAMAKLAHDIVLKAMEKSGFARNVTIKGGEFTSTSWIHLVLSFPPNST